jgi:hypothetical protein
VKVLLAVFWGLLTLSSSQRPSSAPPIPKACPMVMLTYDPGLRPPGADTRSGLVFAVWDSGVVLRAERFEAPSGPHVLGASSPQEIGDFYDAVKDSSFWQREMQVAVEVPTYRLALNQDHSMMVRLESPAGRLSASLDAIRQRVFSFALTGSRRVAGAIDVEHWDCPDTVLFE